MKLGTDFIDFSLKGVDEKVYTGKELGNYDYLAVMFSCNHCPYVIGSEEEMVRIQEEFGDGLKFSFVAINSNDDVNYPQDSFDNMKIRAKERGFNFPYLRDETQEVAKQYGAVRTPEIYLFDKGRKLIYHGRINDSPRHPEEVKQRDFRDALSMLSEGKALTDTGSDAIGCSIKWK